LRSLPQRAVDFSTQRQALVLAKAGRLAGLDVIEQRSNERATQEKDTGSLFLLLAIRYQHDKGIEHPLVKEG
jgi:hypothetical protein